MDPSLRGICGVSLTRFLIRSLPDPVTEDLSFWRGIYPYLDRNLQSLVNSIGSPKLNSYNRSSFAKLLKSPLSLNLKHGINPVQVIKEEIKKSLIRTCDKIQNHIVKHAVMHSRDEEEPLYAFLESISPRFPRFLSEYKAGTYLGMTEGLVGLFQNSKTIRNIFSNQMKKEIDNLIVASEIQGIKSIVSIVKSSTNQSPGCWGCSSERADHLRSLSWGGQIIGATPATNWKLFLQEVNDHGLDLVYLVIGLRGKEREIKRIGRFFALMSWKLRDYFVITEYLIKLHFVPLFSGLTMADDLNTVMKKMLDTSNGQGLDSYEYITLANHIDYEKWNNHQRGEANDPVFRGMGQFLGYPNLITRTHEFFEKSLIYYNGRPDLMFVQNGRVYSRDPERPVCWNAGMVCWNGQMGVYRDYAIRGGA
ncbi:unnamed protein product [Pieris macdunnoughi]|uniref:RdRp catalytic domain-containing protein n=1 Tax=Pieris macdunnoughi TaxID=345717 RepID=A0A821X3Y8_9NEOP|nr:unnamed protein product [Pieris macdunnoughi]